MQVTLDCSTLDRFSHCLELVGSCDVVRDAVRISTPFSYPNGDAVDVFFYLKASSLFREYFVSDRGQTYVYLKGAQVGMFGTSRKREIIGDITHQLDVRIESGELYVAIRDDEMNKVADAIMRIAQACVRISDFTTHQRLRSANPFRDDVEDFLEARQFGFLRDVKVLNQFGNPVRMDFEVRTPAVKSYVNVLAALNPTAAHQAANEIFTKLYSLKQAGHQFVTVYNSASKAVKKNDVRMLGEFSQVVSYPDEQDLLGRVLVGEAA